MICHLYINNIVVSLLIQVGTNGIISFQQPFTHHIPSLFPSELTFISSAYLLAPFWSDVDIGIYGSIFYEVHNNSNSLLISQVNRFLSNYTETDFNGTWMLVVQWDEVHQFPGFLTIPVRFNSEYIMSSEHCNIICTNVTISFTDLVSELSFPLVM